MRIGICTAFTQGNAIESAADFIEENVQRLLVGEAHAADFTAASAGAADCGLPIRAANCFVPGHLKTVGPKRDLDALRQYTEIVMARAQSLGIQTIVFGSGGSRALEEGIEKEAAMDDFKEVVGVMAPFAAANRIAIVIEPLNHNDCNFINTLAEGAAIVEAVDHPNVKLLADLYHMRRDDEGPDAIRRFGHLIRHVHVAEREERTAPGVAGDDLRPWLQALYDADYPGDLSLESRWGDDFAAEAPPAIAELRKQLRDVGFKD